MNKQTLIDRYLSGTASVKEEQQLKALILGEKEEELSAEEKVISMLLNTTAEQEEDIFAADYSEEYDRIVSEAEGSAKQIALQPNRRKSLWKYMSVAAAVVLLMGIFVKIGTGEKESEMQVAQVKQNVVEKKAKPQKQKAVILQTQKKTGETDNKTEKLPTNPDKKLAKTNNKVETTSAKHSEKQQEVNLTEEKEYAISDKQMLEVDMAKVDAKGQDLHNAICTINEEVFSYY